MLKNKIKKIVIAILALAFILPPVTAAMIINNRMDATTIGDLRNRVQNQQAQIANHANQRRELDATIANARREQLDSIRIKEYYDRRIMTIQSEIADREILIEMMDELLERSIYRIDEKQLDFERNYQLFLELLYFTYKSGNVGHLELFLRADNLSEMLTQVDRMAAMANYTKDILTNLQNDRIDIEQERETYENIAVQRELYMSSLSENIETFAAAQREVEEYINTLNMTIAEAEETQRQIDRAAQAIQDDIARMLRDIQAREAAANRQRAYVGGSMLWPVGARHRIVTSRFGYRTHPITRRREFHRGIDIAGGNINGTNIYAANGGTVIISQWNNARGNFIVIDHGAGHTTLYAHASHRLVSEGDTVSRGDVIGRVGSTGWSTGPHLHFEVAINGVPQNPLDGWVSPP